jgi:beta-lactamase class A
MMQGDKAMIDRLRISRRLVCIAGAALPLLAAAPALATDSLDVFDVVCEQAELRLGGRIGVVALEPRSGRRRGYRDDELFPMCSTFKLLAAAAVLARVDRGQERLDRFVRYGQKDLLSYAPTTRAHVKDGGMSVGGLCEAAIQLSDNTAANLILASIGGPAGFTRFCRGLGDPVTRLDRTEPELNSSIPGDPRDTTSPAAMTRSLSAVLIGSVLQPASRSLLNAWIKGTRTGQARLKAGLPPGWTLGHKTGTGDRGSTNDIGILFPPSGPPILAAVYFTGSKARPEAIEAAIANVGSAIAAWATRGRGRPARAAGLFDPAPDRALS